MWLHWVVLSSVICAAQKPIELSQSTMIALMQRQWSLLPKLSYIIVAAALCVLAISDVHTQPGGGGGLVIGGLYDSSLNRIDVADPSLSIRFFRLADSSFRAEFDRELYSGDPELEIPNGYWSLSTLSYSTQLLAGNILLSYRKLRSGVQTSLDCSNQRVVLIYRADTMVVDVAGVWPENPSGGVDYMDSLVFHHGYFWLNRNPPSYRAALPNIEERRNLLQRGVTTSTLPTLSILGLARYDSNVGLLFVDTAALPATFYLARGEHRIHEKQYSRAIADLEHSLQAGLQRLDSVEALSLLYKAYAQNGDTTNALRTLSALIDVERREPQVDYFNYPQHLISFYHTRIALSISNGDFQRALSDYDSIISASTPAYRPYHKIARAEFQINSLHDCAGPAKDLNVLSDEIRLDTAHDMASRLHQYGAVCFLLGSALHCSHEYPSAYRYWLQAMELNGGGPPTMHFVVHFDSLLQHHPDVPELYLSRGVAYLKSAPYLEQTTEGLRNALADFTNAERTGITDYRVNWYRAEALVGLKDYNAALAQVNTAIEKNDAHPKLYALRYEIRQNLNRVKPGDKSDPDLLQHNLLYKDWHPLGW